MLNANEIEALINLIDDPDENIYQQVKERIVSIGESAIPSLENVWELNTFGQEFQQRIEDIIHDIQFESVLSGLENWAKDGGEDLFAGALMVAKYQYPDLDETETFDRLTKLHQEIWIELNEELTALEQVKVMNHILFEVHGFRGNKKNYHAAQNNYISTVLENEKGNPLSLSILYIVLAQRLEIPIFGVNLPNHFIMAYVDEYNILRLMENHMKGKVDDDKVLFYINAFSQGTIVHKNEITTYLQQLELKDEPKFFEPCDNKSMIIRLLNNLIMSYDRLGYPEKVDEIKKLFAAVNKHRL
ncbi:MAG: regulator of sirC expression with transglutaminase-like and TPR domain [Flammeovirgaceae bacterium]|jgi:regulator of sirC expression with transglutaminase-like and TPR domain